MTILAASTRSHPGPLPAGERTKINVRGWLVLILVFAALLRMVGCFNRGLWGDDIFSLIASSGHPVNQAVTEKMLTPQDDPITLAHAAPMLEIWRQQGAD